MTAPAAYPEYVDRGSQWLGRLPAHWGEARIGHIAQAWPSNVDKHSVNDQLPVRLCNYTDVYNNERITNGLAFMKATATAEQIQRFRLRLGDTVITKDSETADDIGVPAYVESAADDLVCGYHLAIVRPDTAAAHPRYLYWALQSQPTARQWQVAAAGVTRVGIRSSDLTKAVLPRPPVEEQAVIAAYLDHETTKIDTLIGKQDLLIATLAERRASLIDETVARGLDPQAAVVPLEPPWLGAAPQHWSVRPLWSMFRRIKDVNHPEEPLLSVFREHGVVPKDSRQNLNVTADDRSIYQLVHPGWLVANRMKAWQGSVGISSLRGIVSGHYICFAPRHSSNDRYLNWLFRSRRYAMGYKLISRGVRIGQAEIDNDDYRVLPVLVPPLEEQLAIADYLDERTRKIDDLIDKAQRFIELARERRSALVTAAVTGQIDVRGAA